MKPFMEDPLNIIMAGVEGQGNVMASRVLANILSAQGYTITIGETFGASQRGGSVMSHIRVSKVGSWSPQIPRGRAHVIIALEPMEAIRIVASFGNRDVHVLVNSRPIHPVGVIAGECEYPSLSDIRNTLQTLSSRVLFIDATEEAVKLGNPVLSNIIMVGAVSALGLLPIGVSDFMAVTQKMFPRELLSVNQQAFKIGQDKVQSAVFD